MSKEWNETKSIHENVNVTNKIIEECMKEDEPACVVDKHSKNMGIIENFSCRVRKSGRDELNNKK